MPPGLAPLPTQVGPSPACRLGAGEQSSAGPSSSSEGGETGLERAGTCLGAEQAWASRLGPAQDTLLSLKWRDSGRAWVILERPLGVTQQPPLAKVSP